MKRTLLALMDIALTKRQREVVEMHFISGRKVSEISGILGTKNSAVYKILKRAKKKLEKSKKYF